MQIKTIADLEKIRSETTDFLNMDSGQYSTRVLVHLGTCGIAAGAKKTLAAVQKSVDQLNQDNILVVPTGCFGMCSSEPNITIEKKGEPAVVYQKVSENVAQTIIDEHVGQNKIVAKHAMGRRIYDHKADEGDAVKNMADVPFFANQNNWTMRNKGLINPEKIDEYIAKDGYFGAFKAVTELSSEAIIDEVLTSKLRGRGGGGFPTGLKWKFAAGSKSPVKYVLCNADEGDPGAFMDRSILESDPHSVIEGMIIAAKAIQSNYGYIYCRTEYPLAIDFLTNAIEQARSYGLLGKNIFGSGFDFDLEIYEGAGAFVCGEETALMHSIEGKRGMPRPRPPFPAVQGLWKKPSILNNVETFANIAQIIVNGGEWYSSIGTDGSKGTKVFAISGNVNKIGLVEVPMGMSLRTLIYDVCGGIPRKRKFKAVQLGGPSGGCVPESHLDTLIGYEEIIKVGAIMGSGGAIIMDDHTCMVDMARFFMDFVQDESCGKCTPCREGTRRLLEILERICEGKGVPEDLDKLVSLSETIKEGSLCGLGQTGPNPVLSTLRYFRDEFEAHIIDKKCPAKTCSALLEFEIDPEICNKCGLCYKACPVDAITWKKKEVAVLDKEKCIHCMTCFDKCKVDAIF